MILIFLISEYRFVNLNDIENYDMLCWNKEALNKFADCMTKELTIKTTKTEKGYSGICDDLPGWIVTTEGTLGQFDKEVKDSINFFIKCAKKDGDTLPKVLQGEYLRVYEFITKIII